MSDTLDTITWATGEWWQDIRGRHGRESQLLALLIGVIGLAIVGVSVYAIGREAW